MDTTIKNLLTVAAERGASDLHYSRYSSEMQRPRRIKRNGHLTNFLPINQENWFRP